MAKRKTWKNLAMIVSGLLMISAYTRFVANQAMSSQISEEDYSLERNEINMNRESELEQHQPTSKTQEMKLRTQRMRQTCSQYPIRRQLQTKLGGKRLFYISEKHKLSYCRVAKVGSTFWTQVFMTMAGVKPELDENGDIKSLFDIPRDEAHGIMKKQKDLLMDFTDERVHKTTSFLVARNPYSRLFSSYIDQIYLPNKWDHAKKMIKDRKRRECGNDVTFDEFLSAISRVVLSSELKVDLHWAPIFSICSPCELNFDILAKQETFNDDADYILNYAGVPKSIRDEVSNAVGTNIIENTLPALVHTYVTKGQNIKEGCVSNLDLASKIWSAFQIQGYIHNDVTFPSKQFSAVDSNNVEALLTNAVLGAIKEKTLSSSERSEQRQKWKVHFWKKVPLPTLRKIQDAYYEDFVAFGYNLDPNTM